MNASTPPFSRRALLKALPGSCLVAPAIVAGVPQTAIRIEQVTHSFEEFKYRAPYQFGGRSVDRVTLINVHCRVRTRSGKEGSGFGSMPLGNMWSFPARTMNYDQTLGAMTALAGRIEQVTGACREYGHPIDLNVLLEPAYLKAAADLSAELKLSEPIPKLCTLVTASAFDAAVHDAFGKVHGRSSYRTYDTDLLPSDLSRYLGTDYKGLRLGSFIHETPVAVMPVFHSVGAADPLTAAEIKQRLNDGLPETLSEWIPHDGITHIKIKLNGGDLKADLDRVKSIHRVTVETQKTRGVSEWAYSLDFNERCTDVEYLLAFNRDLKQTTADAFRRILYVEQPTARDLKANRHNVMFAAAKLLPVVIDESLTDLDALLLAREMGYTGAALKACKGQTQAMLMAAAGQHLKMFLCVQDLTCPGASLVHSAGIAAHVPGIAGIEANARQYVPAANKGWVEKFPGLFHIADGTMKTAKLNGPGLGAVA